MYHVGLGTDLKIWVYWNELSGNGKVFSHYGVFILHWKIRKVVERNCLVKKKVYAPREITKKGNQLKGHTFLHWWNNKAKKQPN